LALERIAEHRTSRSTRRGLVALAVVVVAAAVALLAVAASGGTSDLGAGKASILGVVEGLTEYLPISSTGHLLVTNRILDLPSSGAAGDAVKSYDIAIQSGAILAVLILFRRRFASMLDGVRGRSADGRRLLEAVVIAFIPSAIVGVVSEKVIKDVLFGTWPVIAAWAVGGAAVIVLSRRGLLPHRGGRGLASLTRRDALIIGAAQILSLWPGTSRSLTTIVAALLIGLSMEAAVEFSFMLGFVTLGAATAYEALTSGSTMLDAFGLPVLALGVVVAFAAAVVSIKWMVSYLEHHDLAVFGWYRIAIAAIVLALVASNVI
jgi:undecaprenyl-diphosphatase